MNEVYISGVVQHLRRACHERLSILRLSLLTDDGYREFRVQGWRRSGAGELRVGDTVQITGSLGAYVAQSKRRQVPYVLARKVVLVERPYGLTGRQSVEVQEAKRALGLA